MNNDVQQYSTIQWWMDFNQIEDSDLNSSEFKAFLGCIRTWVMANAITTSDLRKCPKFGRPAWWSDVFGKCPWRMVDVW